ncbi:hypothetical protein Tco_0749091, partial [Tanacetum coccineum]
DTSVWDKFVELVAYAIELGKNVCVHGYLINYFKGDQSALKNFYKENGENVNSKSYVHVVNAGPHQFHKKEDSPAIVLEETYANKTDYSLALLGKVKDFTSLTNLNVMLANEGFVNVKLKYMGGFWVMIVFTSEGAKETFRSKVGIGSWFAQLLQASILS